jgi:nucleoredoxin
MVHCEAVLILPRIWQQIDYVLPFSTVLDKNGNIMPVSSLDGKLVALYFAASWCDPCLKFTPELSKKYEEIKSKGHDEFEIIFLSADKFEIEYIHYCQSMP